MRRVYALQATAQRGALYRFDQQAALSGRCGHCPVSTRPFPSQRLPGLLPAWQAQNLEKIQLRRHLLDVRRHCRNPWGPPEDLVHSGRTEQTLPGTVPTPCDSLLSHLWPIPGPTSCRCAPGKASSSVKGNNQPSNIP
ncbi:hypothetical protein ACRRTK_023907 [Alexandromys fortis]